MELFCPYCKHGIGLKSRVPGRYAPVCPKCSKKFIFAVPADPAKPVLVSPLKSQLGDAGGTLTDKTVPSAAGIGKSRPPQDAESTQLSQPLSPKAQASPAKAAPKLDDDDLDLDLDLDLNLDDKPEQANDATAVSGAVRRPENPAPKPTAAQADDLLRELEADDALAGRTMPSAAPPKPMPKSSVPKAEPESYDLANEELDITRPSTAPVSKPASASSSSPPVDPDLDLDLNLDEPEPEVTRPSVAGPSKPAAGAASKAPAGHDATIPSEVRSKAKPAEKSEASASSKPGSIRSKFMEQVKKPGAAGNAPVAPAAVEHTVASKAADDRSKAAEAASGGDMLPTRLGGYQIVKLLGKGGMGAVFLARQISLDRNVAVKTMHAQWATDPQFLSRFTREAYAAAQLVHHHVVQIYDIGQQDDTPYFSMEFVEGQTLKDLMKKEGRLDPEVAVGYILQAARGLKFAHDHGMVHRDIKPDNLMLNSEGLVKVADLGLVKTPDSMSDDRLAAKGSVKAREALSAHITSASVAMGTPAYMAPEQAQDAAAVDQRADIYSLGCTLYALVTGKPPFEGKTAMEVMTKHATESMIAPDVLVKRVPKSLSTIIQQMTSKTPASRYQNMGQVIAALEQFLGLDTSGPFTPKEYHATSLEDAVTRFNHAKSAKVRKFAAMGFALINAVAVAALAMSGQAIWAGGVLGLGVLSALSYFVIEGVVRGSYLFRKFRQLIFSAAITDWLTWLLGAVVFVAVLHAFNLLWVWLGFCVGAVAVASIFAFVLDRMVAKERSEPIAQIQELLRGMRLHGLEEDKLRLFVCKYAGPHWEEVYETLFGYEGKIEARERWGRTDAGRNRPRHGWWRDSLVQMIDAKIKARQEARERKLLEAIERKALKAAGLDEAEAARKAKATAEGMVKQAVAFQDERKQIRAAEATVASGMAPPPVQRTMIMRAMSGQMPDDGGKSAREKARIEAAQAQDTGLLHLLLGGKIRFVTACLLLLICALWVRLNLNNFVPEDSKDLLAVARKLMDPARTKPLELPLVSMPPIANQLFLNSLAPGLAGLILLVATFAGRRRLGGVLVSWVLAVGAVFGAAFAPPIAGLTGAQITLAATAGLAVLALFLKRR